MDSLNLNKHISGQFNAELESIRTQVMTMGGMVEQQLSDAITAMHNQDSDLAKRVIEGDKNVNMMEVAIDEACVRIIAKRQPTASDLRLVMVISKTIAELERIGDVADKICRTALEKFSQQHQPLLVSLESLGRHTIQMLHDVLDAFARMDIDEAVRIYREDKKVDQEYEGIVRQLMTYMMEDSRTIPSVLTALFCARSIERIGDRCQNICEFIFYYVKGQDFRHVGGDELDKLLAGKDSVFKECFLYRCEIKNFNIDTSKIYSVNQDPNVGKPVGAYLFMQSFVYECTLLNGVCKNASIIASSLLCCKIAKLNGAEMDFIGTSFYHKYRCELKYDNHFYMCDFSSSDMTCKRNGIRKDLLDFDPREYFKKDGGKLNLDKHISNLIYVNLFPNMSGGRYINDKYVADDIDKYLKLSNCNLLKTCLGESINGIKLDDCAIDPSTTWLSGNLAANSQIRIPVYMDMKGAIAENGISDFMENLMEVNSWVEEFNNYGKDAISHYEKELLYLQSLLVKLGSFNLDDEGKKYQLNGEAIQYIILNVLYNIEKDIANEIDIDKVNFMHNLYTGFFWQRHYDERNYLKINRSAISNSARFHFHFNFNDLRDIYKDYNNNHEDDNFDKMQKIFLALNEFKERTEINYRDYRKVSKYVDDKVDLFSSIEQYLRWVIEKNNDYNKENYGDIKDKYAKLIVERNDLVDTKDQLIKEGFYLNNKDNKDKKDAERINEIKGIIKVIDGKIPNISKEILHLKDETERLEKEYQQENTLNDVVQNIRSWLKENENMVKAIKKIDTE